ncbi:hypothetical protein TCAL_03956 [Tigriopus californicus]|uniref:Chitin-binding type-2 domain-containing protein n=1 Tax=Tigriopus californicus TaxID=6832 RepID=A0A553P2T3_TIGCA|nr:chitin deacetylase 1-like [Tigriopus californicus]TRY71989.1 hypothetical protein TCAL_03956 [Tigriopus californicus]
MRMRMERRNTMAVEKFAAPALSALLLLLVLTQVSGQEGEDTPDVLDLSPSSLCKDRNDKEYFRLTTKGDCREVVRCDRAGVSDEIRLAALRCPTGLSFDVYGQNCDWGRNVNNCDVLSKPRKVLPNIFTDEPVCPDGELQCGDGKCMDKKLFCDERPDCADGSDENACSVEQDPNRAPDCDLSQCQLPDCFCSADGTRIPGGIDPAQVPQMITITFNGAVNSDNMDVYNTIFNGEKQNPNGCSIRGSFYVSHKYTNYSAVQELHRRGHEVGVFSITNKEDPQYWTEGTYDDWLAEMAGARLIVERFANITDGSVIGIRAPYLRVGGNKQFEMMADQFFVYDTSISAPLGRVPIWPYTLYYRMPHKCHGNAQNCPSRSHPVWEMVINELDRRDDPSFDERLPGCHMVSSCSNIQSPQQFGSMLRHNFNRHFETNRAPLGLHFHASWLKQNKDFVKELIKFIDEMIDRNDVYFVTMLQVIQWMQNPTEITALRDFSEWKEKCDVKGQPFCSLPNACPLNTRELKGETLRLHTCMECPKNYPWVLDPTGDGYSFK